MAWTTALAPVTGLQALAQHPQRQICRTHYGFFPTKANGDFKSC